MSLSDLLELYLKAYGSHTFVEMMEHTIRDIEDVDSKSAYILEEEFVDVCLENEICPSCASELSYREYREYRGEHFGTPSYENYVVCYCGGCDFSME